MGLKYPLRPSGSGLALHLRAFTIVIARLAVGLVFVAHGWQKFVDAGIDQTAAGFDSMGVPAPQFSAYAVASIEMVAGAALILGVLLPLAGILLAGVMIGALVMVHWPTFYVGNGGYEFVLVLAAASLMIGFSGGGTWSIDGAIASSRAKREAAEASDSVVEPSAETSASQN
ncbi:DoxX family protein [Natronoglycomyces albus]|uniref:DoxX family protein n=1 Tax=Natronoglycomyces albus TaxID=2811108 RepID=A0A895XQ24_9ACTN|nr:DoxX family protein [Natronoglycomyces albus]QSB04646.1 DoxX family protein [Natronoglycomyces albus]